MSTRIPWNQHEVALLIDAYIRVAEGADFGQTAEKLSLTLRKMAMQTGQTVDETYRNVNGMKMQLGNVQYLFTDGQAGLSSVSALVRKMYEMYRTDPARYQEILKEAIQMIGTETSIEEAFFSYARKHINLSTSKLREYLKIATDYCHLKSPLLGMTDVKAVRDAQQTVAEGKLLRFRYGKDAQTIRCVTQLYYTFIKSYHEPKEESFVKAKPSSDAKTGLYKLVYTAKKTNINPAVDLQPARIVETAKKSSVDNEKVVFCEDSPKDRLYVNFRRNDSYLFTKPVCYIYKGVRHDVTSWNRLYVEVCGLLWTDYREAFMHIINGDIPGFNTLAFADEMNFRRMRVPKSFAPGYYLESNLDATSIVRTICGLHQLFGFTDELQIEYRTLDGYQSSEVNSRRGIIGEGQISEDANYNWENSDLLLSNFTKEESYAFTQPEAYEYKGKTRRVNKWGQLYVDLCGLLFEDYHDTFMNIINGDVPGYSALAFADEQHKSKMRVPRCFAPGFYLESNMDATTILRRIRGLYHLFGLGGQLRISYRETKDKDNPTSKEKLPEQKIDTTDFRRRLDDGFKHFLLSEKQLAEGTAAQYSQSIEAVERFLHENGMDCTLDTDDFNKAQRIYATLMGKKDFVAWNNERHHQYSAALAQYVDYLQKKGHESETGNRSSVKDAIIAVLKDAEIPLTLNEITQRIVAQHLYQFKSNSPSIIVHHEIQRRCNGVVSKIHDSVNVFDRYVDKDGKFRYSLIEKEKTDSEKSKEQKSLTADERWLPILMESFPDGYILGDFLSQFQAAGFWQERYGETCPAEGEGIDCAIKALGVVRDGRVFAKNEENSHLISSICEEVNDILSRYSTVYRSCIYEHYQDELASCQIYTEQVMSQQLLAEANGSFYSVNLVFAKPGQYASVVQDCRKVLRDHGGPLPVNEIAKILWFIPYDIVYHYLSVDDEALNIGSSTWMLVEHFPLTRDDAQKIGDMLSEYFQVNNYLQAFDLIPLLQKCLPSIAENLTGMTYMAVFNIAAYYLRDRFSFTKAIIAPKGSSLDFTDLFRAYAAEHETFTLDELETFARELKLPIYWESTYAGGAVRVSKSDFVNRRLLHFDTYAIDQLLEDFCPGDYLPIQAVSSAMMVHLPSCGYRWNGYLLLSYVQGFSKVFRLSYNSLGKTGYYGAMVRESCKIGNYSSLIERVLTDDDTWTTSADALDLLVKQGYQALRRYNGIENIVEKARLNKQMEGR